MSSDAKGVTDSSRAKVWQSLPTATNAMGPFIRIKYMERRPIKQRHASISGSTTRITNKAKGNSRTAQANTMVTSSTGALQEVAIDEIMASPSRASLRISNASRRTVSWRRSRLPFLCGYCFDTVLLYIFLGVVI